MQFHNEFAKKFTCFVPKLMGMDCPEKDEALYILMASKRDVRAPRCLSKALPVPVSWELRH